MTTQKLNIGFTFIVTIILLVSIEMLTGCNSPYQHCPYSNPNGTAHQHQAAAHQHNYRQNINTKSRPAISTSTPTALGQHYVADVTRNRNNNFVPRQIYRYENYPQNKNLAANNNSTQIVQASYADVNPAVIRQMSGNKLPEQPNDATTKTTAQNANTQNTTAKKTAPPKISIENLIRSPFANPAKTTNLAQTNNAKNNTTQNAGIRQEFIREITPLNNRKWSPNHSVLQTADFNNHLVTINNVRYSKYNSSNDYQTRYYNATFDLNQIRTIDLIIVPIRGLPSIAHVESSFGFADGKHVLMSITARYEEGEIFDPIASALRQFELIYVFADERDILKLDSQINKNEVYLYRLNFTPDEVRTMFVDALQRANKLAQKPEFYHPIRNSCVTNLIDHINKGRPKAISSNYKTLLPGMIGKHVFDLKLVDTNETDFKVVRENAKINWLVERFGDLEYFSAGIRNKTY
ncbi:MAG: DUF4105 domain-containing protein [Planctomycetaceae bacterium]|jgi:hypothetical protein|nr:DUF4105 domain-containing protein [Planctomycetaceae bacterium]